MCRLRQSFFVRTLSPSEISSITRHVFNLNYSRYAFPVQFLASVELLQYSTQMLMAWAYRSGGDQMCQGSAA
jgi:hypothetical protein